MKCQWDMSVQIPEFPSLFLIERPAFDVLPFCEPLAPLVPLDFPLFSLLLPLPSLLDHDLLCLPLPDDCLPVFLRALQSR